MLARHAACDPPLQCPAQQPCRADLQGRMATGGVGVGYSSRGVVAPTHRDGVESGSTAAWPRQRLARRTATVARRPRGWRALAYSRLALSWGGRAHARRVAGRQWSGVKGPRYASSAHGKGAT